MFIILNWTDYSNIAIVLDEDRKPMLFGKKDDALFYATSELNPMWEIVEL